MMHQPIKISSAPLWLPLILNGVPTLVLGVLGVKKILHLRQKECSILGIVAANILWVLYSLNNVLNYLHNFEAGSWNFEAYLLSSSMLLAVLLPTIITMVLFWKKLQVFFHK